MSEQSKKTHRAKAAMLAAVMAAVYLVLWIVEPTTDYINRSYGLIFCYVWGLALLVLYWAVYYERGRGRWVVSIGLTLLTVAAVWVMIQRGMSLVHYNGIVLWISHSVTSWVRLAEDVVCVACYLMFTVDAFLQYRLRKLSRVMSLVLLGGTVLRYTIEWLIDPLGNKNIFYAYGAYTGISISSPVWWQMVMKLLLYGSFAVFFFWAAERPVNSRTPRHATLSRCMLDGDNPSH